jgi:hypothetical protein
MLFKKRKEKTTDLELDTKPKTQKSGTIDDCINMLSKNSKDMERRYREYSNYHRPEESRYGWALEFQLPLPPNVRNNEEFNAYWGSFYDGIEKTRKQIEALENIKNGKEISQDQYDLLMEEPKLAKIQEISGYSNIENPRSLFNTFKS